MEFNRFTKYGPGWDAKLDENFDMIKEVVDTSSMIVLPELPKVVTNKQIVIIATEGDEIVVSDLAPFGGVGRVWLQIGRPTAFTVDSLSNPIFTYRSAHIWVDDHWKRVAAYFSFNKQWVQFSNDEYDLNMVQFFAIPGISGAIRLKVEMPEFAENVMIRYKTVPWIESDDITTGTLVADLTNDLGYKEPNNWYTVNGLVNSTRYYFKAFTNNAVPPLGDNETDCRAGLLEREWLFEGLNGSTVFDSSMSSKPGTGYNLPYDFGVVGNQPTPDGASSYVYPSVSQELANSTICFWLTPSEKDLSATALGQRVWHIWYRAAASRSGPGQTANTSAAYNAGPQTVTSTYYGTTSLKLDFVQNSVRIYGRGSSGWIDITNLEANKPIFICVKRTGTAITYIKNHEIIGTGTGNVNNISYTLSSKNGGVVAGTAYSYAAGPTVTAAVYHGTLFCNSIPANGAVNATSSVSLSAFSSSKCDQYRVYNAELTFQEVMQIYNEGKGC